MAKAKPKVKETDVFWAVCVKGERDTIKEGHGGQALIFNSRAKARAASRLWGGGSVIKVEVWDA